MECERFFNVGQVSSITGLTRVTVARMVKRGEFPEPLWEGKAVKRWTEGAVRAWLDERAEQAKFALIKAREKMELIQGAQL